MDEQGTPDPLPGHGGQLIEIAQDAKLAKGDDVYAHARLQRLTEECSGGWPLPRISGGGADATSSAVDDLDARTPLRGACTPKL